jgi:predicted N-acetyltransferase YhbS
VLSGLVIRRARPDEAGAILELQQRAYLSEAALYDNLQIPPMVQTAESLRLEIESQVVLIATLADAVVASVRGHEVDGIAYLGRFSVEPRMQGRGIGTALIRALEQCFSTARALELFTGHRSEGNLRLYRRLGYAEVRRQKVDPRLTLVFLQKHAGEECP